MNPRIPHRRVRNDLDRLLVGTIAVVVLLTAPVAAQAPWLRELSNRLQPAMVKIYGAGGLRQLEGYQSGFLISPNGQIATVDSSVLNDNEVTVVLADGIRTTAKLLGADPRAEIAVLQLVDAETDLTFLDLRQTTVPEPGDRVIALSNLYGIATANEPVSVLLGNIGGIAPLRARRGRTSSRYRGDVLLLDLAANNPGAAGGALVDGHGQLVGMLGKELRSEATGTWLNFAIPAAVIRDAVAAIHQGQAGPLVEAKERAQQPLQLAELGFWLVPDVVTRTPAYVDGVVRDSPADLAGVRPADLVVSLNGDAIDSVRQFAAELLRIESGTPLRLHVIRDNQLIEFTITPAANTATP